MRILLTILLTVFSSAFVTCSLSVYYPTNEKVSSKTVKCTIKAGYIGPYVRVFTSSGKIDPYAEENAKTIHHEGQSIIGIMMPCLLCDPIAQVKTVLQLIKTHPYIEGVFIDIDVVGWKEQSFNRAFFETLINEFNSKFFGTIATKERWEHIFGQDYSTPTMAFLIYRSLNKEPNFNDFKPFGGWRSPNGKHYDANGDVCSKKMDLIYQEA